MQDSSHCPPPADDSDSGSGPILVVDDETSILEVVAAVLEDAGYSVVTAANGLEGKRALEHATPVLILLDIQMPIMNGWEFAQHLKEKGISVPILVMTASYKARQWSQEIGAHSYLPKPFDLSDLLSKVACFVPTPAT